MDLMDLDSLPKIGNEGVEEFAVETLGMEDVDQSQFDDMGEYNDTNILVYIRHDGEGDIPGISAQVAIYACFVVMACLFVAMLIYFSKRQEEKSKTKVEEKVAEEKTRHRRSSLQCRLWPEGTLEDASATFHPIDASTMFHMNDADPTRRGDNDDDDNNNSADSDTDIEEGNSESSQEPQVSDCCQLCSVSFEPGQVVYESNNPQCSHVFHQECMDKWLNVQNTCPVCNHSYVLNPSSP